MDCCSAHNDQFLKQGGTSGQRYSTGNWTVEEDVRLCRAFVHYDGDWKQIAVCLKDHTDVQCLERWQNVLDPALIQGPQSKEAETKGAKQGPETAEALPRYQDYLMPSNKGALWTQEENEKLIYLHGKYGNKWTKFEDHLPGRTKDAIHSHWYKVLSKKTELYRASGLFDEGTLPPISEPNLGGSSSQPEHDLMATPIERHELSQPEPQQIQSPCQQQPLSQRIQPLPEQIQPPPQQNWISTPPPLPPQRVRPPPPQQPLPQSFHQPQLIQPMPQLQGQSLDSFVHLFDVCDSILEGLHVLIAVG